jgi:NAD(P)-dependent dehydrogenase (short-subunit alcohol dehydrogenase family)
MITPRIPHKGGGEAAITARIPMRRRGAVDDVANAVVFLLSDMGAYVSGQTLAVDGGCLAAYPLDFAPPATPGTLGVDRR